jgi:hypothetical protein
MGEYEERERERERGGGRERGERERERLGGTLPCDPRVVPVRHTPQVPMQGRMKADSY